MYLRNQGLVPEISVAAISIKGLNWGRTLVVVCILSQLSSCVITAAYSDRAMRRAVADDFALSLTTLIDPGIPLYIETPQNRFGFSAALRKSIQRQGFTMVDEMSAKALPVSYSIESVAYEKGASERYEVKVGPLLMAQEYQRDSEGIYPVSGLAVTNAAAEEALLQGAQVTQVDQVARPAKADGLAGQSIVDASAVNASVLKEGATNNTDASLTASSGRAAVVEAKTSMPNATDPFAALVTADASATAAVAPVPEPTPVTPQLPATLAYIERKNMYETRVSAFSEFTSEYNSVRKQVLIFPNDSLRITPRVRSALDRLSQEFRPGSDVLSVIGCSHGNTDLDNGNALLAVGRSKRVKRYLADQGVPRNRILDEGCWSPLHFEIGRAHV